MPLPEVLGEGRLHPAGEGKLSHRSRVAPPVPVSVQVPGQESGPRSPSKWRVRGSAGGRRRGGRVRSLQGCGKWGRAGLAQSRLSPTDPRRRLRWLSRSQTRARARTLHCTLCHLRVRELMATALRLPTMGASAARTKENGVILIRSHRCCRLGRCHFFTGQ